MQVNYCDLCNTPLETERHIVVIVKDTDFTTSTNPSYNNKERRTHEICNSCMQLFDKIFEYKKGKVESLIEFLDETYSLGEGDNNKDG